MQHRRRTLRQLFNAGRLDLPLTAPVGGQGPEAAAAAAAAVVAAPGRAAVAAPVQQAASQDVAKGVKRPAVNLTVVGETKRARQQ